MKSQESKHKYKSKKKICNKCGFEYPKRLSSCKKCGSTKVAPNWIFAKRPVNKQVAVEVTETNPEFGEIKKQIRLSKWWVRKSEGDSESEEDTTEFHSRDFIIPDEEQWKKIRSIIDCDLGPLIDWDTKKKIIKKVDEHEFDDTAYIERQINTNPELLIGILEAIDFEKITQSQIPHLLSILSTLAEILSKADESFLIASKSVIAKLSTQKREAIDELGTLLKEWNLRQITAVSKEVKRRLELIELFEDRILDERTYELKGKNSIHRLLENAMWLIDDRYWLLQSNSSLRKLIGEEMSKKDKKRYGKKRPDFACGTIGEKLIIVEIKRPSHTLTIEDLNQLETYVVIAEKCSKFRSSEGQLVGNQIDPDLQSRQKFRKEIIKPMTYSDLIQSAKIRYQKYLQSIEENT